MSAAAPSLSGKEIKFLAVARRNDKAILCSRVHTADKSYDYSGKVHQVMNSPGWSTVTTDKLSLEDGGYMFYVSIDEVGGGGRKLRLAFPLRLELCERGRALAAWRR